MTPKPSMHVVPGRAGVVGVRAVRELAAVRHTLRCWPEFPMWWDTPATCLALMRVARIAR